METARSAGADLCIDYTKVDFTRQEPRYDLILAANGYHSIRDYKRALKPEGALVVTGGTPAQVFPSMFLGPLISSLVSKKVFNLGVSQPNKQDLNFLKKLLEAGKVKPLVDRCYPLSETPDALRYFGEGGVQGKVVIRVAQDSSA